MQNNLLNTIIAISLSLAIMFGWQHYYGPSKENKNVVTTKKKSHKNNQTISLTDRKTALNATQKRVDIKSNFINGSISLEGLRFDDLSFLEYTNTTEENSENVILFSPSKSHNAYFAEIGWMINHTEISAPDNKSIWKSDNNLLSPDQPVTFTWKNDQDIIFKVKITLDEQYMFDITQTIINNGKETFLVKNYGLINRAYNINGKKQVNILHEGVIGSKASTLDEITYDKLKKSKKVHDIEFQTLDWLGITDKYWLASFIPDNSNNYMSHYNYSTKYGRDIYQIDFVSDNYELEPKSEHTIEHKLFVGPKKVSLLDNYRDKYNIPLFDRAIDFGWLYILTKPIFHIMNFCYKYVGNFGISIMIVTILVKLLMFGFTNKSYRSMKKMKDLQPDVVRLKELYGDDKVRMNQELMQLYKRKKINPVSGCLPMLVQIPVFFAIYKVLYVTIEMRHAPFFGWIKDLSAPDPATILNLFGFLSFTPPPLLSFSVWSVFMAFTMFLQQKMSPPPSDPTQATIMKFMPLIVLVMFSGFPVGLLVYWSWNNILSILQQYYVMKLNKDN